MAVSYDLRDGVAWITMDDGKVNAVSPPMAESLIGAIDRAEGEASALVLTGRPGKFSAGFDLKIMQGGDASAAQALLNRGGDVALRLFDSRLPTIALCNGHALAMGALLLLACDTRIGVAGEFKIGLNETAIGMPLPLFGIELPRARLNPVALTAAVVQSRLYAPADAVAVGYLDEVVAEAAATERTQQVGAAFGQLPRAAYRANKEQVHAATIARIRDSLIR
ncbi:MAG: crotonase/enoyl-CoA hydratase family protein [Oceanococcaceae bacterium]